MTKPASDASAADGLRSAAVHVDLRGVGMHFGTHQVLSDIDMRVLRGEIAVIIGGSGTGKTTLLRIIIGLLKPTSGAVHIDGQDIARLSGRALTRARARWGMVFQYSALLDSLTVFENVALPLREHETLTRTEEHARVRELLRSLELEGTEQRYPAELSGGMRKRVALARALIRKPDLIAYDEPSSGLDPLTARLVDDLILSTRERFGVTSIIISHDMAQASRLADRALVLDKGRMVAAGKLQELKAEPNSLAARFFEASRVL
jgi:phospholipid/cholesterol/gamma-HCH transport system ATP-binding protein